MGRIEVMPDALANQIAAGEVVERPASCVKELIENSLDAGAKHIRVTLEDGGIASITVQDDGVGMDPADAMLACARHATSKVHSTRDLLKIATMGFRGEALASIAAVARVTLQTRPPHLEGGTRLQVEGSVQVGEQEPVGVPVGTSITVADLFFNTPARLKYLRSVQTEYGRCVEVVQRAALARPDVALTLEANGRVVFQTNGRGNPLDVAAAVFAAGEAQQLLGVEGASADYRVSGLIGRPTQAKSSRAYGYLFVNRRPIRNYALHQAIVAGYGSRLMTRRHPLYVLNIEMDPGLVDVNIHPHKTEVRLSEERDVCRMVQDRVAAALDAAFLAVDVRRAWGASEQQEHPGVQSRLTLSQPTVAREQGPPPRPPGTGSSPPFDAAAGYRSRSLPSARDVGRQAGLSTAELEAVLDSADPAVDPAVVITGQGESGVENTTAVASGDVTTDAPTIADDSRPSRHALALRPVGQALGMYVIADDGESVYIIDQHAAHERVLYERFRAQVALRTGGRIELLTPLPFRLTPQQLAAVIGHKDALETLGFDIEPFGGTDVMLRSIPEVWEGLDASALAERLFASLAEDRVPAHASDAITERVVTQACKAAIKANHRLSPPEMDALCRAIGELDDPFHCPHGRPILIRLTHTQLEKEFRRLV